MSARRQHGIAALTMLAGALALVGALTSGWPSIVAWTVVGAVIVGFVAHGVWLERQPWDDDDEHARDGTTTRGPQWSSIVAALGAQYPAFTAALRRGDGGPARLGPGRDEGALRALEDHLGAPLPPSYRAFLAACSTLSVGDGRVQIHGGHPFEHEFEPFESLPHEQQERVREHGLPWPPESQGLLCFAEFFLEADGDQVLFDRSRGSGGEWPVCYYAHERGTVRAMAPSFAVWLEDVVVDALQPDDAPRPR